MAYVRPEKKKEVPFEVMLRNFKRLVERSGKLKDVAAREFFETRGAKRRKSKEESIRRSKRNLRKASEERSLHMSRRR
tara:strand:- start:5558 stop:5791 length:234 start_codon:yes stop_codon:yes gene_type:complete